MSYEDLKDKPDWWLKGDGVAYTTAEEVFNSKAGRDMIESASKIKVIGEHMTTGDRYPLGESFSSGEFELQELNNHAASQIRRIVKELEDDGFDDDIETFKSWLLFEAEALENGGNLIKIFK